MESFLEVSLGPGQGSYSTAYHSHDKLSHIQQEDRSLGIIPGEEIFTSTCPYVIEFHFIYLYKSFFISLEKRVVFVIWLFSLKHMYI